MNFQKSLNYPNFSFFFVIHNLLFIFGMHLFFIHERSIIFEIFFYRRVLKYEKFEPPPLSSLSSTSLSKSPEFDAMPDLNMDLMSEMHDVINRKPSPYHMQPPKVNRQVS